MAAIAARRCSGVPPISPCAAPPPLLPPEAPPPLALLPTITGAKAGEVVELSLADATRIEGEDASSQILQPVDSKLRGGPTVPKVATKPAKTAPAAEDDK